MLPTKTAAAGKFLTRGEDGIQFVDEQGNVLHWVDREGGVHAASIEFPDGTKQTSAGVVIPPVIDAGTF